MMPKQPPFVITQEIQKILDDLPLEPSRSRLEAFGSFILKWRREGRTYRHIQQILRDNCRVSVSHKAVLKFVKKRARPKRPQVDVDSQPSLTPAARDTGRAIETAWASQLTPEEVAAMREAARAANQPEFQEKPQRRFSYDPSKPPLNKNY